MSIFFKIQTRGAAARIIQLRGLHAEIGEDQHGILCSQAVMRPFFAVYNMGERYFAASRRDDLLYNGKQLPSGSWSAIKHGDRLGAGDQLFEAVVTSALAEALAASPAGIEEISACDSAPQPLPQLIFHLAGLERRFPLIPQVELIAGSDPEVPIYIDLPGVAAAHFAVQNRQGAVSVRPLGGAIQVDGAAVHGQTIVAGGARITLAPGSCELLLKI